MSRSTKFYATVISYVVGSVVLCATGWWIGNRIAEMIGFILLGGTFLPLPLDAYVLHTTPFFSALTVALLAGSINTAAVVFERYFLLGLLALGKGRHIQEVIYQSKLSAWFRRLPFAIVFIGALSFIPFEPFRFLAVTNRYSLWRYSLATFLGRGIRYYLYAVFGHMLMGVGWLGPVLGALVVLYLLSLFDSRWLKRMFQPAKPDDAVAAEVSVSEDTGEAA
ncbi:MAG TPA: hypothetical protein VFG83_01895 [Kofleriaceae bacterium]|nr:hypothetical protein [Kofleriaceae bacterium]